MIHNTAIIHDTVNIPDSCEIGPNTIIGEGVKLGENVKILGNAYLEHCEIGDNCFIAPFASIGTPPQDYGYKGEPTKTIIGKDTIIREYATINRASGEGNTTNVGEGCMIMTSAHIAHNCQVGDHVILANLVTLAGHIHIGDYAFIGGMSVFHQHVRIGEQCIVSGVSAARQDILPYSKSAGRPAAPHGINSVGLKRRGFSLEQRTRLKNAFKILEHSGLPFSKAVDRIEEEIENDEYIKNLINFIRTSERGISGKILSSNPLDD